MEDLFLLFKRSTNIRTLKPPFLSPVFLFFQLLNILYMQMFLEDEYESKDVVGYVPRCVEEEGNGEGLVFGYAEDGEEIYEEELVHADVPGRGGYHEPHVQEGADEGGVGERKRHTDGSKRKIEGAAH